VENSPLTHSNRYTTSILLLYDAMGRRFSTGTNKVELGMIDKLLAGRLI